MKKVQTAEEFLIDHNQISHYYDEKQERMVCFSDDVQKALIDFAKLHVKAALEAANEKALVEFSKDWIRKQDTIHPGDLVSSITVKVNKDSILNAYPENLIQ